MKTHRVTRRITCPVCNRVFNAHANAEPGRTKKGAHHLNGRLPDLTGMGAHRSSGIFQAGNIVENNLYVS